MNMLTLRRQMTISTIRMVNQANFVRYQLIISKNRRQMTETIDAGLDIIREREERKNSRR